MYALLSLMKMEMMSYQMIEENITIMKMLIYVKKIVHSLNIIQRQKLIHADVE